MGSVFAAKADDVRHHLRSNMLQADQADTGNSRSFVQLGPETRRELLLHDLRINAEVGEDSPTDDSLDCG